MEITKEQRLLFEFYEEKMKALDELLKSLRKKHGLDYYCVLFPALEEKEIPDPGINPLPGNLSDYHVLFAGKQGEAVKEIIYFDWLEEYWPLANGERREPVFFNPYKKQDLQNGV